MVFKNHHVHLEHAEQNVVIVHPWYRITVN